MTIPLVQITVTDNGVNTALLLPSQQVQVKLGCAVGGPTLTPIATTSAATLSSTFVGGPLVEAGGLVCAAGGTVIAIGLPIVTKGTAKAVQFTGTGGSAITTTLDSTNGAWDDFYVVFKCVTGGTIGVAGITYQISLDAGRNFGPILALGTANSYAIPNTGITLNFGAGTLVAGDKAQFQTIAPAWNDAGVQAALTALAASQFALAGWGSTHLVGVSAAGDASNVEGYLDTLATQFLFTRIILDARDAGAPTAWGGSGETEAAWMTSLATNFSATSAKRVCVSAGYYNTPTIYPNTAAGTPAYRRALGWSAAVRRTAVPPQRATWRVRDGSLANIFVNPSTDPADGFIYHDERVNPGLDAARFMAAITWPKKQGFFVCKDELMSPVGSQFGILPLGNVVDITCDIAYETGVEEVGDDLRLQDNGTLYPNDLLDIQSGIQAALDTFQTNVGMISNAIVAVSPTQNVQSTGKLLVNITIVPRGYASEIDITIGLNVPNTAPTA